MKLIKQAPLKSEAIDPGTYHAKVWGFKKGTSDSGRDYLMWVFKIDKPLYFGEQGEEAVEVVGFTGTRLAANTKLYNWVKCSRLDIESVPIGAEVNLENLFGTPMKVFVIQKEWNGQVLDQVKNVRAL